MRIALVEDEKKLAETLKTGLSGEGYTVNIFADGLEAEQELLERGSVYDVILLDLGLPQVNGFDMCRHLRQEGVNTPMMILTARHSIDDKVSLLNVGADDFLTKPFDFSELLARIRALLRRPRQSLPDDLKVADLVLSPATRQARRGGRDIILTPREFDILHYLMRNVGRAVTRRELVERFWLDDGRRLTSNVLDAHIKNLRFKLDHDYEPKLVRTVRGIGFTLQA